MAVQTSPFVVTKENNTVRLTALDDLIAMHTPLQRACLQELLKEIVDAVVLDLSRIEMVDSLGITLVVRLYKTCQAKGLPFHVEGASPELMRLFRFFCLSDLFEVKGR
jgi:anti-anti-sigma factor